jgi:AmmeMemoRadiSam system protein B
MSSPLRPPAVAGTFYPEDAAALRAVVDRLLAAAAAAAAPGAVEVPRALIAPHAGYAYSGPVVARAFQKLAAAAKGRIARVVVIGPSHHVAFRGVAAPSAVAFRTPLGEVAVDRDALRDLPGVAVADAPHRREHAIEVELPFLQRALPGGFALVPLVVGEATDGEVAGVLEPFVGDPATLTVISSDLSHFLDHAAAVRRDWATAAAIERLEGGVLGPEDACGFRPIRGWLALARRHGLAVERLDLKNSGDTAAGNRDRVVGYGAWAFARPNGRGLG